MNLKKLPSPNFDERDSEIDMIILHYTGMKSGDAALKRLCDPEAKVSAHYVVEENGQVYQLVEEAKRAWHAGVSYWQGKRNLNGNSIGIELVNPGHEYGYREFTKAQYDSVIELCAGIKKKYKIEDINIIGHSDIAPERKQDPGELFDWELLAKNGLGLWPNKTLKNTKDNLTKLGYEFHNKASITAFQRHWRQNKVDGAWDDECCNILTAMLNSARR